MTRLRSELDRLYLAPAQPGPETDRPALALVDAADSVRAMVLELARPPSWEALSRVWHGVQHDLQLPAPAIAVSGVDGLQLWFSVAQPIPCAQAHGFLECLRQRYLADIAPGRVRMMPAGDASALRPDLHAQPVPARQDPTGNWSAFLAPDLVPVFAETPWLDIPPNEEGQATLLRTIEAIKPDLFAAAFDKLGTTAHPVQSTGTGAAGVVDPDAQAQPTPAAAAAADDARRFLHQAMNDGSVPMALRIDAAKALLQHASPLRLP